MNLLCHIGNQRHGEWLAQQAQSAKALNLGSDEARAAYWRAFERQREAFYPWAQKLITKQFREELRQIIWRVDNGWSIESLGEVTDWHSLAWRDLLKQINERVGSAFAKRTFDSVSGKARGPLLRIKAVDDVWYEALMDYIAKTVGEKVVQILSTTKELIRAAIREGIANGEGVYEVSQRIEKLYLEQIIPHRAEVIARTETVSASGAGSRAAAKASGLKLNHQWIATQDSRTRDTHAAAHGQVKPLDEPFDVGGSQLMFPGDWSLGADANEIIQCRCAEVYSVVRAQQ